ncbi:MAG: FAD-dependent oxidoreductase [Pseudomonadota bacterium]
MADIKCDVCVIGAGSGGLSFAAGASQMGADVVLLEGHKMGGDCLNYGCVPSKALLAAGKAAHAKGQGEGFGVSPALAEVDFAGAKDHLRNVIAAIEPHDSVERFEGLGVRVIQEFGRFTSQRTVQAGDHTITARRFVIATGSRPAVPPIPGLAEVPYFTNETIFDLRDRPDHLIIIGGGPIGMEMAQAHRRLGSDVTVIEAGKALGRDDPDMVAPVLEQLSGEGIDIREDQGAASVSASGEKISVHLSDGSSVTGSHLLIAVGRTPNIEDLELHKAGIETTKAGVKVDAGLRTSNPKVYAVGDVAGLGQFTHLAGYHAGVIIRPILLGLPAKTRQDHIPRVTYTDPEIAQIGMTEAEARAAHGDKLTVATAQYGGNDRALAEAKTIGQIKVMVVKGRPVGVSIVGAQAGELIGVWALALANKLKMSAIAGMVAPYPTLGEVNKRAAGAYFSPKLFDSPLLKRIVRTVQRVIP